MTAISNLARSGRALSSMLHVLAVTHNAQLPISIGTLSQLEHDVSSGPVYIISPTQIRITKLNYDGQGPDAFFWVGKTKTGGPDSLGTIVPYKGSATERIPGFLGETVDLTLPPGLTVEDINYLALWCRAYKVDFGHISIPTNLNLKKTATRNAGTAKKQTVGFRLPSSAQSGENKNFGSSSSGNFGESSALRQPLRPSSHFDAFGMQPGANQHLPVTPARFQ